MFEAVAGFPDWVWAIEGANGMGRSIAQRLVAFDETVVDVPARLATRVRSAAEADLVTVGVPKGDLADAVVVGLALRGLLSRTL